VFSKEIKNLLPPPLPLLDNHKLGNTLETGESGRSSSFLFSLPSFIPPG